MKIAVACNGMDLSPHAAQCDGFMCYTVERGIITGCRNLPNMGDGSASAADLVRAIGFDTLITGGIDMDTASELCAAGIEVVAGAEGTPREALDAYLAHTLMGCC